MKNNIIKLILAIGFITLSSAISAQKQRIDSLVIKNGRQGLNKVLVCDTNGNATWSTNSDAAWFNTNTNTGATKVNDTMYHTGNISIGNAVTNPDSSQIRLGNNWRNTLNVNTTLTNYSKLVNNGVYAGMLLGNNAAKSTGFYDGFHTDLWTATTSTQDIFWMNSLNAYLSHRGTGTVDIAMGAWTPMEVFGTGRITDAYGFRTQALVTGAGSITNFYGLKIEHPVLASGGTIANRWGVYQTNAGDKNYFAGRTAIGNASNSPDTAIIYPAAKTINALSIQQNDYTAAEYADRTHLQVMGWNGKFLPTTANKNLYGDNGAVQLEAGTTLNVSVLSGTTSTARNFGTGTVSSIYNFFGSTNRGTGLVSGATGVIGNSNNALSGQITTSRGVWGQSLNQSATSSMVNSIGGQFDVQNQIAGGTVTNAYGVRSTFLTGLGTTTNGYGLYIDSVLATNKWSIYTNSGRASIGDTLQLRTVPTGTATDEILVRRAATGDVYKISADSIASKSKNYVWKLSSNDRDGNLVNDVDSTVWRSGKIAVGNVTKNPNQYYGSAGTGSPIGNALLNVVEDFNLASDYAAGTINYAAQFVNFSNAPAGTNPTDLRSFIARQYTAQTSDNIANAYGASISTSHRGTGIVSSSRGILSTAANISTGTITNANGIVGSADNNSTGTITNATGVSAAIRNVSTGTITNSYGVNVAPQINAGTITNGYGLYVNNIQATNDWGVYQVDTSDDNLFRGHTVYTNWVNKPDTGIYYIAAFSNGFKNNLASINQNKVPANTAYNNLYSEVEFVPTGSGGNWMQGTNSIVRLNHTNAGINSTSIQGVASDVMWQGTVAGNVAELRGINSELNNSNTGGVATNMKALASNLNSIAGSNTTNQYSLFSQRVGAGTVTNFYGSYINDVSTGTTTNGYGLYINDIKATNQWGIYQAGANDVNFFAGATTFGGTDAVTVPSGTTAQRNATPVFGMVRYNSTIGRGEMYVNDLNGDGTQGDAGWRAF